MAITDSGERTEFSTGAVRDMHEGKGRCDLLPLEEAHVILNRASEIVRTEEVLYHIASFVYMGDPGYLVDAFLSGAVAMWNAQGKGIGTNERKICNALLEVSIHFEEGCKKYGERNWQKGIPLHSFVDSAIRHYLKFLRGDDDERHDRAFLWNILCAMWTVRNKPELDDIPHQTEDATQNEKDADGEFPYKKARETDGD
jgi:hypothetical protein